MQKRMRHAHPRTPGGRNFVPKGANAPWCQSKFIPAKQPKAIAPAPKKDNREKA